MHGNLPAQAQRAIFPTVTSDSGTTGNGCEITGDGIPAPFTVTNDKTPEPQWFFALARALWPLKAAASLACLTTAKERACYRYAAGEVEPPAHFLVELLRGAEGERVLDWITRGTKEKWDVQRRRARRLVAHDDKAAQERQQIEMEIE